MFVGMAGNVEGLAMGW